MQRLADLWSRLRTLRSTPGHPHQRLAQAWCDMYELCLRMFDAEDVMLHARYDSLDALSDAIESMGPHAPEYYDKMLHEIPPAPSVDRASWLVKRLAGKTVLHLGGRGPLHAGLRYACKRVYGIDREPATHPDDWQLDVEDSLLPSFPDADVVLIGEFLEHLTTPGALLGQVRGLYAPCEVIITAPNAGSAILQRHLRRGIENVNVDHVCWYSYRTLRTLLERCGFALQEWMWYGGVPIVAEGLIFVVRAQEG